MIFRGGVAQVDFADDDQFTTNVVTLTEFAQEGNNWPDPEQVSDALADGQEGPTAVNVPFDFRALNVATTDVSDLQDAGYDLTRKFVRFTAQDGNVMVLSGVIPSVLPAPIADRGVFGVVKVAGMATGVLPSDAYDVNPS